MRAERKTVLGWFALMLLITPLSSLVTAEETPQMLLSGTTTQADLALIDPEFSQTDLPKLVLPPPEPPARVRLPALVVKADEWRGVQCGILEPRYAVFRHADKWASFWEKAIAPMSERLAKVPPVDFSKDMVLGVFMGEKGLPDYEIEIRSIKIENHPDSGNVLVVRYREITKMIGVFVPPFPIQPFHLKRVPVFDGQVVFLKVKH